MPKASIETIIRISSYLISAQEMARLIEVTDSEAQCVEPEKIGKDARLIIALGTPKDESLESHITAAHSKLIEVSGKLHILPQDREIDIWCSIYCESEFFGFALDKEMLSGLSALGVNFVCSIYARDEPT